MCASRTLVKTIALAAMVSQVSVAEAACPADSTGSHWGVSATVTPGSVIVMDEYQRQWQQDKRNMAVGVKVSHCALPSDSDAFASDYGYPTLSLGMKYSFNHGVTMHRTTDWNMAKMVDYESRMGNVVSFYGSFERSFFRSRRWTASYEMNFGVAYSQTKYNKDNNVDDELIGSRWLIHFGGGIYAGYRFAHDWGLKAGVEYYHYSNGALNRPNKGANFIGPVVGVAYQPYYEDIVNGRSSFKPTTFKPYWYLNFAAALGGKTLDEDWQKTQFNTEEGQPDYRTSKFHFYTAYSLRAAAMYRYARRWASGIGADFFYGTYASHIEDLDNEAGRQEKHSPVSFGLSACHEVFYHRLSLAVSLGWYLYRHMGATAKDMETPYYEHIGLRYALPVLDGLQVGVDVKAHKTKADLTEVVLVLPVKL